MRQAFLLLALVLVARTVDGQVEDNRNPQLSCDSNRFNGTRSCEIRESSLGPSGSLEIQPGHNGSIIVKGWSENGVLVRALVETWAPVDADRRTLSSQVRLDTGGGLIRATGPDTNALPDTGWAVSLEVFAPWRTNLKLESHNGGITVSDIHGRIAFQSHNGGVHLTRIAGDVSGDTHNGAIRAELQGNTWEGGQLELNTHNGSITLSMPASYSASVQAASARGNVSSDFPINVRGQIVPSELNFDIGRGGPLIKVRTHNGGIRLKST